MNIILCKRNFISIGILVSAIISAIYYECKGECLLPVKTSANTPIPNRKNENSVYEIIYPNASGNLQFNNGDLFYLSCTENLKILIKSNKIKKEHVTVKCINNKIHLNKTAYDFKDFLCEGPPTSTVTVTRTMCKDRAIVVYVGFNINNGFLKQYAICFDKEQSISLYSWYEGRALYPNNDKIYRIKDPEYYKPERELYSDVKDIGNAYTYESQIDSIRTIFQRNRSKATIQYINRDTNHFLTRGHLSPKKAFLYAFEQTATNRYENMVPQWGFLNSGDWSAMEDNIQSMLTTQRDDKVIIATGIFDSWVLPDSNNQLMKIFLIPPTKLPVSKYIWKLYYNSQKPKTSIAYISLNNPYQKLEEIGTICNDICPKGFRNNNSAEGSSSRTSNENRYIYCCKLDDFLTSTKLKTNFLNTILVHLKSNILN